MTKGQQSLGKKLRANLLLFYFVPMTLVFVVSLLYFFTFTQAHLAASEKKHLLELGELLGNQVQSFELEALTVLGPQTQIQQNIRKRLSRWMQHFDLSRIAILDLEEKIVVEESLRKKNQLSTGASILFPKSLEQAFLGQSSATPLFENEQGHYEQSAFTPIWSESRKRVLAVLILEADAKYFKSLAELKRLLAYVCLIFFVTLVVVGILVSRSIINPIEKLYREAQKLKNGSYQWPIRIKANNEIGFLAQQMEDMREKVQNYNSEMEMMLKGVAHEIRNPLGGIELSVGLIQEQTQQSQIRDWALRIQHEVQHLKMLVQNFLEYADGAVLNLEEVSAIAFFEDMRQHFEVVLAEKNIQWEMTCATKHPLYVDKHLMRRVVLNLVQNSIESISKSKGKIKIKVWEEKTEMAFSIRDDGDGMNTEQLKMIFKPFYTQKSKGMGLGLAFVSRIIKLHRGQISVESIEKEGSVFTIKTPTRASR